MLNNEKSKKKMTFNRDMQQRDTQTYGYLFDFLKKVLMKIEKKNTIHSFHNISKANKT